MKLLLLEDDFDNQLFINVLFKESFEIETVDNYDSAFEKINETIYDLFIIDISLRGKMNGLDFVRDIRKSDRYKNVPVACLTAHNYPRDRQNSFDAGVDLFLVKPIHPTFLKDAISTLINRTPSTLVPAV